MLGLQPIYSPDFYILNIDNKEKLKRQLVDRSLYENPKQSLVICETWKRIIDGQYNPEVVNSIFQYPNWIKYPDLYDTYYFCIIWAQIIDKEIYNTRVHINQTPCSDKDVKENNSKLKIGLDGYHKLFDDDQLRSYNKGLFEAVFNPEKGRTANADGRFVWKKPLYYDFFERGISVESKSKVVEIPPGDIPLEVGYTDPFTTYCHLKDSGGVARWGYESKNIFLFINPRHERFDNKKNYENFKCLSAINESF